jgi:hypothetical protein
MGCCENALWLALGRAWNGLCDGFVFCLAFIQIPGVGFVCMILKIMNLHFLFFRFISIHAYSSPPGPAPEITISYRISFFLLVAQ